MKLTEAEKKRRSRVVTDLAKAAQHLRIYQNNWLASEVDRIADGIHAGHIITRPVQ